MHTVFALLCFVVVIHWLIFPYPSGLLRWHCGNLTIAPVPAKQPWWIWINTPCEFIMNDCITITKQSTTKPCAYFLGYTVVAATNDKWPQSRMPVTTLYATNIISTVSNCKGLHWLRWNYMISSIPTPHESRAFLSTGLNFDAYTEVHFINMVSKDIHSPRIGLWVKT